MTKIQVVPFAVYPSTYQPVNGLTVRHLLLTAFATLSGFLYGCNYAVTIDGVADLVETFSLSHASENAVFIVFILGALLSCLLAAPLNDVIGRRPVIIFACLVFIIGDLLTAVATNLSGFFSGRFLTGVSTGLGSTTVPMYISECAPSHHRGQLVVGYQFSITLGIMISSIIKIVLSYEWRTEFGIVVVPAILQLLGMLLMPESPRWLIASGKKEEAIKALAWLRRPLCSLDSIITEVEREIGLRREGEGEGEQEDKSDKSKAIESSCWERLIAFVSGKQQGSPFNRILHSRCLLRALTVGCLLQAVRQFSGLSTLLYYAAAVISLPGAEKPAFALNLTLTLAIICMVTLFVSLKVDNIGRRILILASIAGVIFSLLILAIVFQMLNVGSPAVTSKIEPPKFYTGATCLDKHDCLSCTSAFTCGFCCRAVTPTSQLASTDTYCLPIANGTTKWAMYGPCATNNDSDSYEWSYRSCPQSETSYLAILVFLLYALSLAVGIAPLPWVINAEIFPDWARSSCLGVCNFVNCLTYLIVFVIYQETATSVPRYGFFYLFSALSLLPFLLFVITLPETKGLNLEETEKLFYKPWNFRCFEI